MAGGYPSELVRVGGGSRADGGLHGHHGTLFRRRTIEGGDGGTTQGGVVPRLLDVLHDRRWGHDLLHHPQPEIPRV